MPINYNSLTNYYNANALIPIIGGGLLKVKNGLDQNGNVKTITFEQYLIEKISDRNYGEDDCPRTISELALKFPNFNSTDIEAYYKQIPKQNFDTELLDKLVSLENFNFFITTTYDNKLEQLINLNNPIISEPIYWNHEKRDSLLINFENKNRKIVYLFGGISEGLVTEELSITEEDKLESLFSMSLANSRNKSTINNSYSFLEYLKGKVLLFIGNNFEEWFMRFMVRTLYNSPYKKDINKIYIINDNRDRLGFERYFFEKFGIQIIHDAPIENVISNLYSSVKGEQEFKEKYKLKVFISYDRQDSALAKKLYLELRNKGIDTWFDTRDLGIVAHQAEIMKVIGQPDTCIFISLISHALILKEPENSYVKTVEWKTAEAKNLLNESLKGSGNDMPPFFIVPIALDVVSTYIHLLPSFIRNINILSIDDHTLVDKIEALLIN